MPSVRPHDELSKRILLLREVVELLMWELSAISNRKWEELPELKRKKGLLADRLREYDWTPGKEDLEPLDLVMLKSQISDLEYQSKQKLQVHLPQYLLQAVPTREKPMKTTAHSWALILIAIALAGAGISYHFTLESRFATIEQKLDQNTVALQQYQISQDTVLSSKAEALTALSKEVDDLQTTFAPLGKATHEQTSSLDDLRKQIASLQQAQQAQQDAQKKLSDYTSQLTLLKQSALAQSTPSVAPAPAPAPAASAATVGAPTPHVSAIPLPFPPRADNAVDLRPAQTTMADQTPVRALPVALPVTLSVSDDLR